MLREIWHFWPGWRHKFSPHLGQTDGQHVACFSLGFRVHLIYRIPATRRASEFMCLCHICQALLSIALPRLAFCAFCGLLCFVRLLNNNTQIWPLSGCQQLTQRPVNLSTASIVISYSIWRTNCKHWPRLWILAGLKRQGSLHVPCKTHTIKRQIDRTPR